MLFIRCLREKYENLIDNAETSSLLPKYSMQTVPIRLFQPFPSKCEKKLHLSGISLYGASITEGVKYFCHIHIGIHNLEFTMC